MSKEFKKGDRVKLLQNVDYAKKGMIGTCMVDYSEDEFGYKFIPVEFDNDFDGGHGCAGLTNPDRGHYIDPNVLKKIEPSHAFTLVITSKGDHTEAKLLHGKEIVQTTEEPAPKAEPKHPVNDTTTSRFANLNLQFGRNYDPTHK